MSWFSQLFSNPRPAPANPDPFIPEHLPSRMVVCGLLANGVDGAAGDKVTEEYIRWLHHLSSDPRYDERLSSWMAVRPFDYTINATDIAAHRDPSLDCPPATVTKTFLDRLRNVARQLERKDTLVIVLLGLEEDPTYIFLEPETESRQDPRKHPHAEIFMEALTSAYSNLRFPVDLIAPFAPGSRWYRYIDNRRSKLTFIHDSAPAFDSMSGHTRPFPFLSQPSEEERDAAVLDTWTHWKLYNTTWDASDSEEEISYDEVHACYTDMMNTHGIMSSDIIGPLKSQLRSFLDKQMTEDDKGRFLVLLNELKRQRAAYRSMAEDLGLWNLEGEVMCPDDKWMFILSSHLSLTSATAVEMDNLGLDPTAILLETGTYPPYRDPIMWLIRRWAVSGRPVISKEEWEAAAQRAVRKELKYAGCQVPFELKLR